VIFQKLTSRHDRQGFDCGIESVNQYLQRTARQAGERDLALTCVLVPDATSTEIVGFHTLMMASVSCSNIPQKGLPRSGSAPVVLLAQFGVNHSHQGQGFGKILLYDALHQALRASELVGCLGVVLDAVDENAKRWYEGRDFSPLLDASFHLWLPISSIRKTFGE
jgi:GNAT superfamily N-acetyltransferase